MSAPRRTAPVAVITGANSGVGYEATRLLAREGWRVVMVCRSGERGEAAREEIAGRLAAEVGEGATDPAAGEGGGTGAAPSALELELCDLASLDEVRELASRLRERDRLDVLVNNAGVYLARLERTADGFEKTMAVNHLAHFLLTELLLGKLREGGGGRVVTVSSNAHRRGDLRRAPVEDVLRGRVEYSGVQAYCDSKLANVLFATELARREGERGVLSLSLHPGTLATRIWNRNRDWISLLARPFKLFMDRPETGGRAVLKAATDPELEGRPGLYLDEEEPAEPSEQARDVTLAGELRERSAEAVAL